jgi:assimilatory nitrate reductase catalytic subunit
MAHVVLEAEVRTFYELFAATTRVVTAWSQGVNQSAQGTDKVGAIINCHLATGRIGRPGMGPFSLTGQPNAMGGREVGGLANQLAAHMNFTAPEIDRVRRFISISTPHDGTWTAFLLGNSGARQMRPGSSFLRDLNHDASMLDRLHVTSIWTPLDLTIVPARSSMLPIGRAIRVHVAAHAWMVTDRRVIRLVLQALSDGQ